MFGLSFGEILIIAVLALLLLGPDRLPEAAKTLGKGLRDLRRATEDIKDQVEREIYVEDGKKLSRPALVPPVPAAPVPVPSGPPPPATSENVPGLEAALAEPPGAEPLAAGDAAESAGVREPTAEDVAAAAVPLPTGPGEGTKA